MLLLGTFPGSTEGDAARRQARAQQSLAALAPPGVTCVNVWFPDRAAPGDALPVLPRLRQHASLLTGRVGPLKPVVSEMLDVLAEEAAARGLSRIGVVNGDVIVLPEAIRRITGIVRPAIALSRTDFGGDLPESNLLQGVDMVVFDRAYWQAQRRRFRPYLLGEPVWDNVYAAIIAGHGGAVLNRERLILHERHATAWIASPYAAHTRHLAARDSSYFSQWCAYVAGAEALRARGGSADEEMALQQAFFHPPGLALEALDAVRGWWWRGRRTVGA